MKSYEYGIALTALATAAAAAPGKLAKRQLPPVDSAALQAAILPEALLSRAQALQEAAYAYPERNRLIGGGGSNDTITYIFDQLTALGGYYDVVKQPWSTLTQVTGTASLAVDSQDFNGTLFEYSPSGEVTAPIVVVNNLGCEAADFPAGVSGNIALISRGSCQFGLKSALAGAAGAAAAIIYDNIQSDSLSGTLGIPPRPEGNYVPTVGITQAQGQGLVASIGGGTTVTGEVNVATTFETRTTNNVIATTKCGNQDTILALGAHSDSVAAGPGINDDGSGTVGILEVAVQLAKYETTNAVRFGWWSGEEEGLLGSTYYVENLAAEELAKIRAYLNFDMIASPNYNYLLYDGDGSDFNLTGPAGSAEIEHFFEDFFASQELPTKATAFDGRSDYQAFIDNGIPAGGTFTGAEQIKTEEEAAIFGGTAGIATDPNYHQAGDTVDNLNITAFEVNAKAIAAAVATYATSFDSLPPKEAPATTSRRRSVQETTTKRGAEGFYKYRANRLGLNYS